MVQGRFYYSRNGSDVRGPVSGDELRRLWKDNELRPGSLLWREGENHWTPLAADLERVPSRRVIPSEIYAQARQATAVAKPATASSPVASFVPPLRSASSAPAAVTKSATPVASSAPRDGSVSLSSAKASAKPVEAAQPEKFEEEPEEKVPLAESSFAVIVNLVTGFAALVGVALTTLVTRPVQTSSAAATSSQWGAFVAALVVIVIVPCLLARLTKGLLRLFIRTVLIIGLAVAGIGWRLDQTGFFTIAEADEPGSRQRAQSETVATRPPLAEQGQKPPGPSAEEGEKSRLSRDVLSVTADLQAKVKASEVVEQNCKFTLDGVKSASDLTGQIGGIAMLREAQGEVVDFLNDYDQHCREALEADHAPAASQADVIAGARQGAHVDSLMTLWQAKMKLSGDHVARLAFLQKNWGRWQLNGGQVDFDDKALVVDYDKLIEAIGDDINKIRDAQKQVGR